MSDRGERDFIGMPSIGASMYDRMMKGRATTLQVQEIADYLLSIPEVTKLLDVGTGPGRLLIEVHKRNPAIELYGLDISQAMISQAEKNLENVDVNLYISPIQNPVFEENYFDLITCTGSFYLWNEPEKGLNEIHRILKPGRTAYLFETYSDYDEEELNEGLKENLQGEGIFRRITMPRFLKKQLRMTYSLEEIRDIILRSKFADSFQIASMTIANLNIWVRLELNKS